MKFVIGMMRRRKEIRAVTETIQRLKHAQHREWICFARNGHGDRWQQRLPVRVQCNDRARRQRGRQLHDQVRETGHWSGHHRGRVVALADCDRRWKQVGFDGKLLLHTNHKHHHRHGHHFFTLIVNMKPNRHSLDDNARQIANVRE